MADESAGSDKESSVYKSRKNHHKKRKSSKRSSKHSDDDYSNEKIEYHSKKIKTETVSSDEGIQTEKKLADETENVLRERLKQKYLEHEKDKCDEERIGKRKSDKIKHSKERNKYRDDDKYYDSLEDKYKSESSHRKHKHESRSTSNTDRHHSNRDSNRGLDSGRYSRNHYERDNREKNDRNQHNRDRDSHDRRKNEREWDQGKSGSQRDQAAAPPPNFERNQSGPPNDATKAANVKKEEPDFKLSGKLTEYTNTYNGVVILYNEPVEARKPKTKWRLYPFKGDQNLPMLQLHRQSAFLLGRDRKVADIPVDHPSCSKQHAVLQFRLVDYERPDGMMGRRVRPYVIDLESTNGTYVNNKRIDPRRYVELLEKDVVKFGFSSREYVLLHEKSQADESSDESDEEPGKDKSDDK